MPKGKACGNPFEIWDGRLPLHTMIDMCNNCSPKSNFNCFFGGVGLDKPLLETSLEAQTLTSKLRTRRKKKLVLEI